MRKRYPSDLTDQQWEVIRPLLPDAKPVGRRARWTCARSSTRCCIRPALAAGDMLPHDLLAKSTVSDYFARWRADGTFQEVWFADYQRAMTQRMLEGSTAAAG